jgi:hypothetical protein
MGKAAGALDVAFAAIESGASVQDDEVFASYQEASLKKRDQNARQEDDKSAAGASDGAKGASTPAAEGKTAADRVADIVCGKGE